MQHHLEERERKILQWLDPEFAKKFTVPIEHEWQSKDGKESQFILTWTGQHFRKSWTERILKRVRDSVGGESRVWELHWESLRDICDAFFIALDPVLNAVTVTPSRGLFAHWARTGRYMLDKSRPAGVRMIGGRTELRLDGLSKNLRLPIGVWRWEGQETVRTHTILWSKFLTYRGEIFPEWRVFMANVEEDGATLRSGQLPELNHIISQKGEGRRALTSMIYFWRASADGIVKLLVVELASSAKLVSFRWSQQPFECFMLSHIWNFDAMNEALDTQKPRWT